MLLLSILQVKIKFEIWLRLLKIAIFGSLNRHEVYNMKKSIIAFISLITLCIEPLMASAEFSFKKYQVENGLSHNTTWCAIQDSYGFYG